MFEKTVIHHNHTLMLQCFLPLMVTAASVNTMIRGGYEWKETCHQEVSPVDGRTAPDNGSNEIEKYKSSMLF